MKPDPLENTKLNNQNEGNIADLIEDENTSTEVIPEYIDTGIQDRLWLKAVIQLLQIRSHETDPSDRVQYACDMMHIAACERASRLLNSDIQLPVD